MKAKVIPINHPSWIFRGNWAHSAIQPRYLKTAHLITEGKYEPIDVSTVPPSALLYPSLQDLREFSDSTSGPYTLDIEQVGWCLICLGILDTQTEKYVCVRFRKQGAQVYEPEWLEERVLWTYNFLADPLRGKIFHNGQTFDIPKLEQTGFTVNGYVDDTMIQAHLTYAELPKKLEFLALLYANLERWKQLVSSDEEEKESI